MIKVTTTKKKVRLNVEKKYSVEFKQIPAKIAGLSVYQDDLASILTATSIYQEEARIKKIIQEHAIDKIILMDPRWFKKLVRNTKPNEVDVELFITKKREIMLYITYGVEPAILLVTLIR